MTLEFLHSKVISVSVCWTLGHESYLSYLWILAKHVRFRHDTNKPSFSNWPFISTNSKTEVISLHRVAKVFLLSKLFIQSDHTPLTSAWHGSVFISIDSPYLGGNLDRRSSKIIQWIANVELNNNFQVKITNQLLSIYYMADIVLSGLLLIIFYGYKN